MNNLFDEKKRKHFFRNTFLNFQTTRLTQMTTIKMKNGNLFQDGIKCKQKINIIWKR